MTNSDTRSEDMQKARDYSFGYDYNAGTKVTRRLPQRSIAVAEEEIEARSVAEALQLACHQRCDPHFDRVINASSVLIDGRTAHQEDLDQPLTGPVQVEVLPPFAGGS